MKRLLTTPVIFASLLYSSLIIAPAIAAESGTALKSDTLRAEPYSDAKASGKLTKNESLQILTKKGPWLQVQTKTGKGWVRLLSVKRASSSSGSLKGAMDVASGRAGTGKVVSTTGIRGLSAEELKTAKFSEPEMQKLDSYAVNQQEAQKFAKSGGLSATKVAYLKGAK
jgi:hypothetical protein